MKREVIVREISRLSVFLPSLCHFFKAKVLFPFTPLMALLISGCSHGPVKKSPEEKKAELYYDHGTIHLIRKNYTKALSHLLEAVKLQPENSKIHNNLGMAYFFKKDNQKAMFHLKKSLDFNPKNSEGRNNLASVYMKLGHIKEARKEYALILKDLLYEQQHKTYYNLALMDIREKRTDKAYANLKEAIKINPHYCPAHYQLGILSRQKMAFQKSIEFFKKASLGPCVNNPAPQYLQALNYLDLNRHEDAFHKFKEIMERFPASHYSLMASRKLKLVKVDQFRKRKNNMVKMEKWKKEN